MGVRSGWLFRSLSAELSTGSLRLNQKSATMARAARNPSSADEMMPPA